MEIHDGGAGDEHLGYRASERPREFPVKDAKPIVFIVDDDATVRDSLEMLIPAAGWRAQTYSSAEDFLACPRVLAPSCLLLDVSLPDIDGLELQRRISLERSDMPIVFISGYGNVSITVQAMKAGALDFLTKPLRGDEILSAVDAALGQSLAALTREAEMRVLWDRYSSLSVRERQVMGLVVKGLLNKQVASELDISEITVKAHRGHAMRKMNARSLADMVIMSARLGEVGRQGVVPAR